LKTKGHLTFLPPQVVGQQLASDGLTRLWQLTTSTWELLELGSQINFKHCFDINSQMKTLFLFELLPLFQLS
jgi:hypothetical protein